MQPVVCEHIDHKMGGTFKKTWRRRHLLWITWWAAAPLLIILLTRPAGIHAQPAPLCRLGINATFDDPATLAALEPAPLRLGWYIDYRARTGAIPPAGARYMPMIRLQQRGANGYTYQPAGDQLNQAIAANQGADWIIGNEMDRRYYQDDLEPHVYAQAYHDLYTAIKAKDASARVFVGAIVQPTPLRLQYLDMVLQSYLDEFGAAMPVDGWTVHNFILNEASCNFYKNPDGTPNLSICWGADIPPGIDAVDGLRVTPDDNDDFAMFTEQIVRFRRWLRDRGYNRAPLYLSEYGILMPPSFGFDADRVNQFMDRTFDYLLNTVDPAIGNPDDDNRLVQRLAWYSTNDTTFNGYLYQPIVGGYELSAMGQNWIDYVTPLTTTADFQPVQLQVKPIPTVATRAPVTLTLSARIANSGHSAASQTFEAQFFNGDPAQGGQLIGAVQSGKLAGCGSSAVVTVRWPAVRAGDYTVYVQVRPGSGVIDHNRDNDQLHTKLFFATSKIWLPLLGRPQFLQ